MRPMLLSKKTIASKLITSGVVALLLAGCSVQFVSKYDERTDQAVTALQKKVEGFLVKLEQDDGLPECVHAHHKDFYSEAKIDVSSIQVRADSLALNSVTARQIHEVSNELSLLEALHKVKPSGKCITREELGPIRTAFNSTFIAILKFELAKKRLHDKVTEEGIAQ